MARINPVLVLSIVLMMLMSLTPAITYATTMVEELNEEKELNEETEVVNRAGEDENEPMFICGDDSEIPFSYVNDDYQDCPDGADEQWYDSGTTNDTSDDCQIWEDEHCEGEPVNWFDCNDNSTIWINQVNDDHEDCPDGEDESEEDCDEACYQEIFDYIDADHDGEITQEEFENFSCEGNCSSEESQQFAMFISMGDADSSGGLSFDEYWALVSAGEGDLSPELLFAMWDADNDDTLSFQELIDGFNAGSNESGEPPLSSEEEAYISSLFDDADEDANGSLDLDEFTTFMETMDEGDGGPSPEYMMAMFDANGDDLLSFEEIIDGINATLADEGEPPLTSEDEAHLSTAFDDADADADGLLDIDELTDFLESMNEGGEDMCPFEDDSFCQYIGPFCDPTGAEYDPTRCGSESAHYCEDGADEGLAYAGCSDIVYECDNVGGMLPEDICDAFMNFDHDAHHDPDDDGVTDDDDNCPDTENFDQDDLDSDDIGDVCDDDIDGDGTLNNADDFPNDANETTDSDDDGVGDNADQCPNTTPGTPVDSVGCIVPPLSWGNGTARFIYIKPETQNADGATPYHMAFPAPPMADASPYSMQQICFKSTGHSADVWVGFVPEPFNNITSWKLRNSNNLVLGMFVSNDNLSGSASMEYPTAIFTQDVSVSGHAEAEVVDQQHFNCSTPPFIDSDGDGVSDANDAFPNDASETADSDGDGVGDNADAFPTDASETADADGDGIGDNADTQMESEGGSGGLPGFTFVITASAMLGALMVAGRRRKA